MSRIADCALSAMENFKNISADELKEYATAVIAKSRSYKEFRGQRAIQEAMREVNEEMSSWFFEEAQTYINNSEKFNYLYNKIVEKKATLRELVGTRWNSKGDNIEVAQKAAQNRMLGLAFDRLNAEEVAYLANRDNQMEVAKAFDGYEASPQAQKIAENLKQYLVDSTDEMVRSNALPLKFSQNRRHLGAVHDRAALLTGGRGNMFSKIKDFKKLKGEAKQKWIQYIKTKINIDETFQYYDEAFTDKQGLALFENPELFLNNDVIDGTLGRIYDNIVNGRSEVFTKSVVLNDAEAVAKRARMFFVWKDLKSFAEYNELYGQGDLFSAIMHDAESKGRQIGRAELMGSDADLTYTSLKETQQQIAPKSQAWYNRTDLFYKEVRGDTSAAVNPDLATFFGNIRQYSSMARLAALVFTSITDVNMAASYVSRWGENYGNAMINQLKSVFAQGSSEDRRILADMMHMNLKAHIGFSGKFTDIQSAGDLTNKLSAGYFRLIGMKRWDMGNRVGAMQTMSYAIGKASSKNFDALSPELQKQLIKHDIQKDEWEILRKYTSKTREGQFFSLENVNKLTDDDLRTIQGTGYKKRPLYLLRNELYRKVYSIFEAGAENAILTPNAWTKMLMTQGTSSGTWMGEAMRTFMQFKGFALSYIDRALLEGFHDASPGMGKIGFLMQQFGLTLPLSYLSTHLYYWSQGLTAPDIEEMSYSERVSYLAGIMLPGIGVFANGFDATSQNQNLITNMLLTPSMRLIANTVATPLALGTLNPELALKNAKKALQYATPGGAHLLGNPYVKQFLGDEPYLQPGQQLLIGGK